jgi:nitrate reductase NapE component
MIRGLVPKDCLLEWCVEDGWEPLCKVCDKHICSLCFADDFPSQFLDKPIPNEPFPAVNNAEGFEQRKKDWYDILLRDSIQNMIIATSMLVGGFGFICWKIAPERLSGAAQWLHRAVPS